MGLYKVSKDGLMTHFKQEKFDNAYYEELLEDWIEKNPWILLEGEKLLIIGRQESTEFGKTLDLLGVDELGNTAIIELKRGTTPREVVAQLLEYSAWVEGLDYEELDEIAICYFKKVNSECKSLKHGFISHFRKDIEIMGEGEIGAFDLDINFNSHQRLFIIAQEISPEVEVVARFLRKKGVDISCIEFTYYRTDREQIINTEYIVGRQSTPVGEDLKSTKVARMKHPSEIKDFLIKVREKLKAKIRPEFLENLKETKTPSKRLMLGYSSGWVESGFHYFVHFGGWDPKKYTPIYVGLSLTDPNAAKNEEAFQLLKTRQTELKQVFGRFEPQVGGEKTRFVDEKIQWSGRFEDLKEDLIDKVTNRLKLYIETLQPILNELEVLK